MPENDHKVSDLGSDSPETNKFYESPEEVETHAQPVVSFHRLIPHVSVVEAEIFNLQAVILSEPQKGTSEIDQRRNVGKDAYPDSGVLASKQITVGT